MKDTTMTREAILVLYKQQFSSTLYKWEQMALYKGPKIQPMAKIKRQDQQSRMNPRNPN